MLGLEVYWRYTGGILEIYWNILEIYWKYTVEVPTVFKG